VQISKRLFLSGMTAILIASPAVAHHSFAMFDAVRRVTLVGTVKEFRWANPHIEIRLMVRDAAGEEVEWTVEGASPSSLARRGWRRTSLKAGDHAEIVVHPMRNGAPVGVIVSVLVNGVAVGARP